MAEAGHSGTITFTVELDEKRIPSRILWQATEAGVDAPRECDGLLVSLWDRADEQTMGIDLWTSGFTVAEMHNHLVQTLVKLADTCERATANLAAAGRIRTLAGELAEELAQQEE